MTPDERQLISDLFDRMRQQGRVDKDRDADSLISQAVRQTPDAAYLLVQSVLAQEHYLQEAGARIQELEQRNRELEDDLARSQQAQPKSGGSFLGGLFGGGRQEPQPAARGSVPAFGAGRQAAQPSYGQPGSPWGQQQPQRGGFAQGGAFGGQQPMQQQAPAGGGFMRTALATAAGVAGGMMAANAISGMLGGNSSATAATPQPGQENSPFAVNQDDQAALNAQQDAAQDAELENEQTAFNDSDSSWGGADDSEY